MHGGMHLWWVWWPPAAWAWTLLRDACRPPVSQSVDDDDDENILFPGIMQMDAYPDNHPDRWKCWPGDTSFIYSRLDANTIKALCNVAVKVTVTGAGVVKWAPVVLESYRYGGPGPGYVKLTNMSCQKHNASGLITSK
jgi:hypothetical protein